MEYDIIPPPKRKFGDDTTDIVPVRGLKTGGPYHIPDNIKEDKVYLVPIVINSPEFSLNCDQAIEFVGKVRIALKEYFKVKSEVVELSKVQLNISDYSIHSAYDLYHRLSEVKHELIRLGYREKLSNIAVLLFTRSTAPQVKVTPYYVSKMVFSYEPVSQIVTERALANPRMSHTNIALGIFTKLGGMPWRLNELMPSTDLIIGVGRTTLRYPRLLSREEVIENWMGSLAIIRSDGIFREARASVVGTGNELIDWVTENINKVINSFILKHALEEINVSIHYSGKKVSREEMERIEGVVNRIKQRENVKINVKIALITDDIPHRFMCESYNMYPLSGFYWILSEREAYLTPLGASLVGSRICYPFTGIPHTLKVVLIKTIGSLEPKEALIDSLHEIHSLTFMHLAGLNININEPVSIKYSRRLAYLVRSLEIAGKITTIKPPATTVYDRLWFL